MKLRGRISFHFLVQFFILFIVSFLVILGLLILLINYITKDELKTNPREAVIENIPTFILISDEEEVSLNDKWKKQLKDNKMWLQVIDKQGDVIYNSNTPSELDNAYTINELLQMEETHKLDEYNIEFYYDEWMEDSHYFLFGYEDMEEEQLKSWYKKYSEDGRVDSQIIPDLEEKLKSADASIEIYEKGDLVQTIGNEESNKQDKLDIISSIHSPGKQKSTASTYIDEENDTAWVYRIPNKGQSKQSTPFLNSELKLFLVALLVSLGIAVLFSIWNGYRYGKPMFIMIRWLEAVEQKHYTKIFSEKEQRKVYKKNGKVKFRYRLYKEVIQSFSNMTRKLARADEEREQLDRVREEWMAGISHDLRTPLSSIQGYGHILESDRYEYTTEELQQIGNIIRTKSDYMVELLNDFSLVFKLKNSTINLKASRIDLASYTKDIVTKFSRDLTLQAYSFHMEEPKEEIISIVDPKLFKRVLDNFFSNAVKHNPPQTVITVQVFEKDGYPTIQIKDNGTGMESEFLNQLFNRYYRGTSTQEKVEGEGLGMSIAKAVVDLHEGEIYVDSEKNQGTIVTIQLQKPSCKLKSIQHSLS